MAAMVVARQPASMMARVDRLDLLLGYLEEMHRNGHGHGHGHGNAASPPSVTTASSPSIPVGAGAGAGHGGLVSSDDDDSSAASTPRGSKTTWSRPRPAKEVLEEAQTKGSLIDRIAFLEHRVLKMEEDMDLEITPSADEDNKFSHQQPRAMVGGYGHDTRKDQKVHDPSSRKKKKKKGLKSLVKSCVRGNVKTKD